MLLLTLFEAEFRIKMLFSLFEMLLLALLDAEFRAEGTGSQLTILATS